VLGEVVDTLLAEDDIGAGADDLVDHIPEHRLFLVQEGLELVGGGDLDLGVDLSLLDLDGRVQEGDLGVLDLLGHVGVEPFLVDDHAVDELGIGDAAAHLLLHGDVVHVHGPVLVHYRLDRLYGELGQLGSGDARPFAGHGGDGDLLQQLIVIGGYLYRHILQDGHGLLGCGPVSCGDDGGVDLLVQQLFGLLEKLARQNHGGGGSVADLVVLGLGDLDHHLGRRVLDVHLLEDGDAVIGYDHVAQGVHQHLVHALGTECGTHGGCHSFGGHDVRLLRLAASSPLTALSEYEYRGSP